ncbi:MAG: HAMP domain-containing histidine kinase, partial [Methyloversatilis sp.]|nr:HAMP domain-containing histidine kinase [Methyloversatilis sp.]
LMGGLINIGGGLTFLFYLLVLVSFGRNAHGTMRNALMLTRQNARLADDLRQERDAVQAAMRAKNLFLAGVTHDLRQPVHAVGLHVRYLRSQDPTGLSRDVLDEVCGGMDAAVRAMSRQLTRLLELSRLEAGEARVLRRAVPLSEVWAACAAQFVPLAQEKGLDLRFRPTARVVDSDAMMLQSILDNLVSNAVRYTERGRVLVAARPRGNEVELQVWDTGPGIAAEHLPLIFVPYRRFDDRSARHDEGQGLGLALARGQADALGHALEVRSRPGHGSTFTVTVPRAGSAPRG